LAKECQERVRLLTGLVSYPEKLKESTLKSFLDETVLVVAAVVGLAVALGVVAALVAALVAAEAALVVVLAADGAMVIVLMAAPVAPPVGIVVVAPLALLSIPM